MTVLVLDVRSRPWLAPLGLVLGGAAAVRARLYARGVLARERLAGPVISVGNLGVGGRGKTPAVVRIAALLREAGHPVAVLSRGYGGSFRGEALVVSEGQGPLAGADEAGDEPVMLARALPGVVVAVGRDRAAAGRAVEARFGRRVHVLDDGFQHMRLARDLDVLCLDAADLADRPMPAGSLREFPSARARADLLLVTGGAGASDGRTFAARREAEGFFTLAGAARARPPRAVLLSGIARPERFAADVRAAGVEVLAHLAFRDHHPFTPAEVARAVDTARRAGATAVVTTEKDGVRLPAGLPEDAAPIAVFRIRLALDDEAGFRRRVLAAVEGRA